MKALKWENPPNISKDEIEGIAKQLKDIPVPIASLLIQKGYDDYSLIKDFLAVDKTPYSQLHDSFLMKGMERAVERIKKATQDNQTILVYGDYDVDGICSVASMVGFLQSISNTTILHYQPDRYKEGYGVSQKSIEYAKEKGVNCMITLDCGINENDNIKLANDFNIDVIVCDHHTPKYPLPSAYSILNPKQEDCNYPYGFLCGCGVGFKLMQGLCKKMHLSEEKAFEWLDLVALATSADIVPMTGENRALTYLGIEQIKQGKRPSIREMFKNIQYDVNILTSTDLIFKIAPSINAIGRLKHANEAVEFLLEKTNLEKRTEQILAYNKERKTIEKDIFDEALEMVEPKTYSTLVYKENWHKGVIGIVASRLIEHHHRPTAVVAINSENIATGSVRSVGDFDVYNALKQCSDLFIKFGGHPMACGFSLKKENLEALKTRFENIVKKTITTEQNTAFLTLNARIQADDLMPDLQHNPFPKLYRILKRFQPFGPDNENPIFLLENTPFSAQKIGEDEKHIRLNISLKNGKTIQGIGFGLAKKYDELIKDHTHFDLALQLGENHFRGEVMFQVELKDFRPSKPSK